MKRGPYELKSSEVVYKNHWMSVREDRIIRPNGENGLYGIVTYSAGIAVVAVNDKNETFLVKEYAYAIDEYNTSIPSGGVEPGESPLEAAKRELMEEAGVEVEEWVELGYINPYTMIIDGPQYLFLAKGARIVDEHEEEFELITVPFEKAYQMVLDSEINHSGSCVAILKAKTLI